MATLEEELITYLQTQVPGIVLEALHFPLGSATPIVIWNLTQADHVHNLSGAAGVCTKTFEFTILASDPLAALTLGESIRLVLHGFRGFFGSVQVNSVLFENEHTDYVQPQDATDVGYFGLVQDWTIKYQEVSPVFS